IIAGWGWIKPFCEVNASIEGKTDKLQSGWVELMENNLYCVNEMEGSEYVGDSGGPLLVDFGDSWYQIGVVTQGMCNKDKKFISNQDYATFTQIDCEWIQNETKGKVLCI
uniref:Peptidase S1 domain-containing protein n=1 Tax=Meloidogyne javanica TaxID=6303 RepID=A0A915MP90_MELJA